MIINSLFFLSFHKTTLFFSSVNDTKKISLGLTRLPHPGSRLQIFSKRFANYPLWFLGNSRIGLGKIGYLLEKI